MTKEEYNELKEWLDSQQLHHPYSLGYKTKEAAIIGSSDPFALFAYYIDNEGVEQWYINGVLQEPLKPYED